MKYINSYTYVYTRIYSYTHILIYTEEEEKKDQTRLYEKMLQNKKVICLTYMYTRLYSYVYIHLIPLIYMNKYTHTYSTYIQTLHIYT